MDWIIVIFGIVGAVIANLLLGLAGLIIYCFSVILISIVYYVDYLGKLIRITNMFNERLLTAIIRKLKIADQELESIAMEQKMVVGERAWNSFIKDIEGLLPR